jgi:hypothetical protein
VPLRNQQPEAITTHGFVECTGLLPEALCARLGDLSMDKVIPYLLLTTYGMIYLR